MCQLFAISETSGINKKQMENLLRKVRDTMVSQKDGFGFAMLGEDKYYIHRYVKPNLFEGLDQPKGMLATILGKSQYQVTGKLPEKLSGPMIAHGRWATNEINLMNTHPFEVDGWAVAHNGVVHHKLDQSELPRKSSNDSEHVANIIAAYGTEEIHTLLTGSIACIAISPEHELLIVKDERTHLLLAEFKLAGVRRLIAATTRELINAAEKILKVKLRSVNAPTYKEIKIKGGEVIVNPVTPWESTVMIMTPRKIHRGFTNADPFEVNENPTMAELFATEEK